MLSRALLPYSMGVLVKVVHGVVGWGFCVYGSSLTHKGRVSLGEGDVGEVPEHRMGAVQTSIPRRC